MKTKEELNAIKMKKKVETLNEKLAGLSEEELKQVAGGGQQPEGIVYKYRVGQLVWVIGELWYTKVTKQAGWDRGDDCPKYEVEIISVPSSYTGYWQPGKIYVASEADLQGGNEPPKPRKPRPVNSPKC